MAGKTNYKAMTLVELEELERNLAAQSKRPSVALKAALRAARADAMHEAAAESADRLEDAIAEQPEAAAPAPEPAVSEEEKEARFTEALLGVMSGATSVDQAFADLTGETVDKLAEVAAEIGPRPVLTAENEFCGCGKLRAECGGHEITDEAVAEAEAASSVVVIDPDQVVAEALAGAKARRREFRQQVTKLMDGGFTVGQAAEALAADFPDESAAELAAHSMDASIVPDQPPARDPRDIDMNTGELKVDRPAEQPAPPATAYALVEAVAKPVTYYWARVTICVPVEGGGETTETISCTCQYGHEREDLAIKHAKKLAAERGVRLA